MYVILILFFFLFQFQCCGVDNYTDLHRATQWDRRTIIHGYQYLKEIPLSCCLHDVNLMLNKKLTNIKDRNCTIHPTPYNSYINKVNIITSQHIDAYKKYFHFFLLCFLMFYVFLIFLFVFMFYVFYVLYPMFLCSVFYVLVMFYVFIFYIQCFYVLCFVCIF